MMVYVLEFELFIVDGGKDKIKLWIYQLAELTILDLVG